MGAMIVTPKDDEGERALPRRPSDAILLEKLQSLKRIINGLSSDELAEASSRDELPALPEDSPDYTYEDFCQDLDPNDVYTQRLLELLVRETASRRRSEPAIKTPRYTTLG